MLIHVHLREKYTHSTFWPEKDGDEELERMRSESSMRVYKCLKLLALVIARLVFSLLHLNDVLTLNSVLNRFYCQVRLSSSLLVHDRY